MSDILELSTMSKTWIFDLDGTIVEHNGYLKYGKDKLLQGVKEFWKTLSDKDYVIILTARESKYRDLTLSFLEENGIWFTNIIFDAPKGERILINDIKPEGLHCAYAINTKRDEFMKTKIILNEDK